MSLFYCTVHSIMWTIRNSKALGKKQQQRPRRLFNPSFFFLILFCFFRVKSRSLCVFLFVLFFPLIRRVLMKKRKHSGFRSQEARHGRWATFGTLCCSSSVLNAQRRKSTPTRRQAVDSTTSIDDYCIMCSFFFFSSSVFETKGPFRRAEEPSYCWIAVVLFFVCT